MRGVAVSSVVLGTAAGNQLFLTRGVHCIERAAIFRHQAVPNLGDVRMADDERRA